MAIQTQMRRDSENDLLLATPADGEMAVNQTAKRLHVGDGARAGGVEHANFYDVQNQVFVYKQVTGTNNLTYDGTDRYPVTAYTEGQKFTLMPDGTNTGAVTLNLGAGVASIVNPDGSALAGGEIEAGKPFDILFDGTNFKIYGGGDSGGLVRIDVFTTSGTWTRPAGVTKAKVIVTGGGASPGFTFGRAGGTSSFGSHCSATGGNRGSTNDFPGSMYLGSTGGNGVNGDINITGGTGHHASLTYDSGTQKFYSGGHGGASYWGGGGDGGYNLLDGANGQAYGSGGGGDSAYKGGGAGGTAIKFISAGLGATEIVTVGEGGAASGGGGAGKHGIVIVESYR